MNEALIRDFKGIWICKEIWLTNILTLQEKILLVEIDSLDNHHGCFVSNDYFAKFFDISKSRVSQIIKSLETKGFIQIAYIYAADSKNIEKRIIQILPLTPPLGSGRPSLGSGRPSLGSGRPSLGNAQDNNIINNIINKRESKPIINPLTNNSLFPNTISKKEKAAKNIETMLGMTNVFSDDARVIQSLKEYFKLRLKKGLQPNQWKIILEDLKQFAKQDNNLMIEKIRGAIAGGYMQIIASWDKNKKPIFDNTADHSIKAVAVMSSQEKANFNNSLAKDKAGREITF